MKEPEYSFIGFNEMANMPQHLIDEMAQLAAAKRNVYEETAKAFEQSKEAARRADAAAKAYVEAHCSGQSKHRKARDLRGKAKAKNRRKRK